MTLPSRSLLAAELVVAAVAFGLWPPQPRWWAAWLATWLAMVLALWGVATLYQKAKSDPPTLPESFSPAVYPAIWAHEVRTPLMHLSAHAAQIRRILPEDRQDVVDRMEMELERVNRLMEQFLVLSVPNTAPIAHSVDLCAWVTATAPLWEAIAAEAGHRLLLEVEPVSPIHATTDVLQQMLGNVLANAIRHGKPEEPIVLRLRMDGPLWVELSLSNAADPPMARVDTLSRPFVRGTEDQAIGGSGLGLAVVSQLVRRCRGRLQLTYQGNTFGVYLRFARAGNLKQPEGTATKQNR